MEQGAPAVRVQIGVTVGRIVLTQSWSAWNQLRELGHVLLAVGWIRPVRVIIACDVYLEHEMELHEFLTWWRAGPVSFRRL